jgi:uncharacterized protein YcfL
MKKVFLTLALVALLTVSCKQTVENQIPSTLTDSTSVEIPDVDVDSMSLDTTSVDSVKVDTAKTVK